MAPFTFIIRSMDYFKNSLDYATATATTTQQSFLLQLIPELREIHHYKERCGKWRPNGMTKRFRTLKLQHFTSSFYCHTFHEPSSSFVFSNSSYVYVYDLNSYYNTFLRPFSSFVFYDSSIDNSSLSAANRNAICKCYFLSDGTHITRIKVLMHL